MPVPLTELTTELKLLNKLIIIIGAICLGFVFIISFILSRSISNPILKLVSIMKSIENGNFKARTHFKSRDEMVILGTGFNQLMDKIECLMADIVIVEKAKRVYHLKLLQAQIRPHFLYNTLEAVMSLIQLDMKDKSLTAIKHLSNFYRRSLSDGNDIISIEQEINLSQDYLSIQQLRYVEFIDFELKA